MSFFFKEGADARMAGYPCLSPHADTDHSLFWYQGWNDMDRKLNMAIDWTPGPDAIIKYVPQEISDKFLKGLE